jgi:hypothetical protein
MKTLIGTYVLYGDLEEDQIQQISGAIIDNGRVGRIAELTYEQDIPMNKIPSERIVKMSHKEHVDNFFKTGSIQFGNFEYYTKFDHGEIGDNSEGSFLLVGRCPGRTGFVKISGGFNHYVFCAYQGEVNSDCINKFGYDSSFVINDVEGFSKAISKRLKCMERKYSSCIYRKDKVLVGSAPENFPFLSISPAQMKFVSDAKYFLKPQKLSHQKEFRFIWRSDIDLVEPKIIECPEAIQFCERG